MADDTILDDKVIQQLKTEVAQNVIANLKSRLTDSISQAVHTALYETIYKEVLDFMNKQIKPTVQGYLMDHKDGVLKIGISAVDGITSKLSEVIQEHLKDKLKSSYDRKKLIEAILGP
jgi:F0F1-type ATP synthase membrane subunit b/b'